LKIQTHADRASLWLIRVVDRSSIYDEAASVVPVAPPLRERGCDCLS